MTPEERKARNNARVKAWHAAHPEARRAQQAKYRVANLSTLHAKNKAYNDSHAKEKSAYGRAYYMARRDDKVAKSVEYRRKNHAQIKARWARNKEAYAERHREWATANPHVVAALRLKRRAAERQATPAWANPDAIKWFYLEAARLTVATGLIHEVDHIYPIQGRDVSGLHCEANLQILTRTQNRRKSNRFTPHIDPPQSPSCEPMKQG